MPRPNQNDAPNARTSPGLRSLRLSPTRTDAFRFSRRSLAACSNIPGLGLRQAHSIRYGPCRGMMGTKINGIQRSTFVPKPPAHPIHQRVELRFPVVPAGDAGLIANDHELKAGPPKQA